MMPSTAALIEERRVLLPPVMPEYLEIPDGQRLCLTGEIFATRWQVDVVRAADAPGDPQDWLAGLAERCQAVLETIDAQMSPWRETSELVRFNRAADGTRIPLPEPMRTVLAHALEVARLSGGAFDPTLHDAVALWGFGPEMVDEGLPASDTLAALGRARRSWRDLAIENGCITAQPGLTLDLCAIAKGYAVDAVMEVVQAMPHAKAALVEIGGELKGWGLRPDAMPWWVEIEGAQQGAQDSAMAIPTIAALYGWAMATSGDYRRQFSHDGSDYSHAIDPHSLAPVRTAIASASVFDPDCWRADALATAMMVMGKDAALAFADAHAITCLLQVREEGGIGTYLSPALQAWCDDDD